MGAGSHGTQALDEALKKKPRPGRNPGRGDDNLGQVSLAQRPARQARAVYRFRRLTMPARAASPLPNSSIEAGSGIGSGYDRRSCAGCSVGR